MKWDAEGLSETTSEILILIAVIVLALIVGAMIFGVFRPIDKSAYLVPQFNITHADGKTVIVLFDRGGDEVYFNNSPKATYKAELYVDTQWGTYKAVPVSTLTILRPGDTIYIYNTGTGFAMNSSLAGTTFNSLPAGTLSVRLVDTRAGVLIAKEDLVKVPVTTTTTATTTTTTTTTTLTTIPLPSLGANFDWAETGKGGDVHFTDTSTGNPTSWSWNFGDGSSSTVKNPSHNFGKHASSVVTLTVTRTSDGAKNSVTKTITTA